MAKPKYKKAINIRTNSHHNLVVDYDDGSQEFYSLSYFDRDIVESDEVEK